MFFLNKNERKTVGQSRISTLQVNHGSVTNNRECRKSTKAGLGRLCMKTEAGVVVSRLLGFCCSQKLHMEKMGLGSTASENDRRASFSMNKGQLIICCNLFIWMSSCSASRGENLFKRRGAQYSQVSASLIFLKMNTALTISWLVLPVESCTFVVNSTFHRSDYIFLLTTTHCQKDLTRWGSLL